MLLRFGLSAFAMPPIGGVVVAAGSVTAAADVAGAARADKNGSGGATCVVTRTGTAQKQQFASGTRVATATAVGTGKKLANAVASGVCTATGAGTSRADKNGGGSMPAWALPMATATKTQRVPYAQVNAVAVAEAEAALFAYAAPLTIITRAYVFGMTAHPAYGSTGPSVIATGQAQKIKQAGGNAVCTGSLNNTAGKSDAVGGGIAHGAATLKCGPRLIKAGVGYHDGLGESTGNALVSAGAVSIAPALVIAANSDVVGTAQLNVAAFGSAICTASGSNGEVTLKPPVKLEAASLGASLVANASVTAYANAASVPAVSIALVGAAVKVVAAAGGATTAINVSDAVAEQTTICSPAPAQCSAGVSGDGGRRVFASGAAAVLALVSSTGDLINPLSPGGVLIEADVPDVFVEADVPDNLVLADAYDNLVEAA